MKTVKNWINNFISLFFPSISAYRTHDKAIIEYIENNTLIDMNCRRILNLSPILILLPVFGIKGLYSSSLIAFIIVSTVAVLLAFYTIFFCNNIGKALKQPGNGLMSRRKYYKDEYERFWYIWTMGMVLIGFCKLNVNLNGSYLYITQLCVAFFPLVTPKKLKKIGILTAVLATVLTANLVILAAFVGLGEAPEGFSEIGTEEMVFGAVVFILTNIVIVFIISIIIQRFNLSVSVLVEYVKLVGFLDQLTGVYNRRGCKFRIDELVVNSEKAGVIMLDIDYFKKYNDTFGHIKGDEILQNIADALKKELNPDKHIVSRFGGEEFAIICFGCNEEECVKIAENIREYVYALQIPAADNTISDYLTVSLGVSMEDIDKDISFEKLIANADKALYKAKENGRNRVVLYK